MTSKSHQSNNKSATLHNVAEILALPKQWLNIHRNLPLPSYFQMLINPAAPFHHLKRPSSAISPQYAEYSILSNSTGPFHSSHSITNHLWRRNEKHTCFTLQHPLQTDLSATIKLNTNKRHTHTKMAQQLLNKFPFNSLQHSS